MAQLSLLFGVLLAAIVTVPLARRTRLPQPVLMTLVGIVLALLPSVPDIRLEPDLPGIRPNGGRRAYRGFRSLRAGRAHVASWASR